MCACSLIYLLLKLHDQIQLSSTREIPLWLPWIEVSLVLDCSNTTTTRNSMYECGLEPFKSCVHAISLLLLSLWPWNDISLTYFSSTELSNPFQQNLLRFVGLQQCPLVHCGWGHVLRFHLADTFAGNCLWYVPYWFSLLPLFLLKWDKMHLYWRWTKARRPPLDR